MSEQSQPPQLINFLSHDYDMKVTYLTNQFQRMWTRFNYMVSIETALFGGKFLFKAETQTGYLYVVGIVLSLVWYVMGAEDRYLVRLYRNQVRLAAERLADELSTAIGSWSGSDYLHVGSVDGTSQDALARYEASQKWGFFRRVAERVSGWRWEPVSTTKLAAFFPLLVGVFWVLLLVFNPKDAASILGGG